jgi:hypothetical protein
MLVSNGSEGQQRDDSKVLCTCRSNRGTGWGFSRVTTYMTRTSQCSLMRLVVTGKGQVYGRMPDSICTASGLREQQVCAVSLGVWGEK